MLRYLLRLSIITVIGSIGLHAVCVAQTPQYSTSVMPQGPGCNNLLVTGSYGLGSRTQMLYKPSNFGTAPSGLMTAIYVRTGRIESATTHTWQNVVVRMQLYTSDTLPLKRPIPYIKTGWTTVFSQPMWTLSGSFVADQWIKIPLLTPFGFTRERNMLIEFSIDSTITGGIGLRGFAVNSYANFFGRSVDTFATGSYGSNIALGFDLASTGVNGVNGYKATTVYPVPASNELFVSGAPANMRYAITDIAGRVLLSGNHDAKKAIDVSGLNAGMYLLTTFSDGAAVGTAKFTKE